MISSTLRYNLGQLALLIFDCLPAPLVVTKGYRALRRRLSRNPERYKKKELAVPYTRGSWRERKLAGPETDLVVDGFPGSANSFVSNVIRSAIDRPARIESHFHYTVQLRRARHFGVPTIVVVRAPMDACSSQKSKVPEAWDWLIVLRWLHFYRYVDRRRDDFFIVPFGVVIRDVDVLRRQVPAVAALVARPLEPDQSLRRKSARRIPIQADRGLVRWITGRAESLHRRLLAHGSDGIDTTVDPVDVSGAESR